MLNSSMKLEESLKISALTSYLMGFDLDFDLDRQQKHIRKYDFWTQVNEYVDSLYQDYYVDAWGFDEEFWGMDEDYFYLDDDFYNYDDYLIDMTDYTYEMPATPEIPTFEIPAYPQMPTFESIWDDMPERPVLPPRPKLK